MTPKEFIQKWQGSKLAERAYYQEHFNNLCALVEYHTPVTHDTNGDTFFFEEGAKKRAAAMAGRMYGSLVISQG